MTITPQTGSTTEQRRAELIDHLVQQHDADDTLGNFPSFSILRGKHQHAHHPLYRPTDMLKPDHDHQGVNL